MGFPNTTMIHGSNPNGTIGTLLNENISWMYNANPWNVPLQPSDNQTHLTCLTNNVTVQDICCKAVGGQIVDYKGSLGENATASNGSPLWCALPEKKVYNDHYNTQPALVDAWAQCYNASVNPANNPGRYRPNITVNSDVWLCELRGNYSGSNPFDYPNIYAVDRSGNAASIQQVGRYSLLAIAGVISIAMVAASSLGGLRSIIYSDDDESNDH